MKTTIIGLDLAKDYSQISYFSERTGAPETVSVSEDQDRYLIETPEDLFRTTEEAMQLGIMSMANFIRSCISVIRPVPEMDSVYMMITMREIRHPWINAVRDACEMLGINRDHVFLQSYRESFFYYVMNQKRDLWSHASALFEYEQSQISSYMMRIDYDTKPALVTVEPGLTRSLGYAAGRSQEEWNARRDEKFLELIRETFQEEHVSSTFLIGDSFDKTWAVQSLQFLCRKRHVFQGRNLYTKGACYAMCRKMGIGKNLDPYLYQSENVVETNISIRVDVRGRLTSYMMISAGVNWYEAEHTCEIMIGNTNQVLFYGKTMRGGEETEYTVSLKGLPERPGRTTRLEIRAAYISPKQCKVTIKDLGFGEFFPSSGKMWESILDVEG